MPASPSLSLLPTVQQAISNLLTTYAPEFLRLGYHLFLAFVYRTDVAVKDLFEISHRPAVASIGKRR